MFQSTLLKSKRISNPGQDRTKPDTSLHVPPSQLGRISASHPPVMALTVAWSRLKIGSTAEATSVAGRRGEQRPVPARRPVQGPHPLSEATVPRGSCHPVLRTPPEKEAPAERP